MITMFNNEKQIAKIEKSLKYDEEKYKNSKEYRDYITLTICRQINSQIRSPCPSF
jgi:hypothetical protein